ncbi:TonB-dependent receptor [Sphingobium sp. DEHP117]|uniref:TonB-dependent receptor n=1 Tax=Sphingobium sp. DEHP117 TaxID=2993436 RepID=UPI0027D6A533|nr:TonB-dependent receptor [Sphingobium sp. DEHP117]MDQ4420330.1 TonB-dependent receptor [Sphingobium sp. DEHP117]
MNYSPHCKMSAAEGTGRLFSRIWRAGALAATALSPVIMAAPGLAAEATAAPAETEVVDDSIIVVTAQRRTEALEDVPMTVTVLTPESLAKANVNNVRDLANVTTGYQLGNGGTVPQPAIRGITTTNAGAFENNVAVYIDDVYQTLPAALNIDMPNIQNVQVLKGPQGTLYGRNATGGAILISTIDPGKKWTGKVELTYARFDDKRASAFVSGPISDQVGVSLAGYIRRTDGWIKKASRTQPGKFDGRTLGIDQDAIRAKLYFEFSDSFSATAGYAYTHVDDPNANNFTHFENVTVPSAASGGTTPTKLGGAAFDLKSKINVKQNEGFLKLKLETGIGELRSISAYTNTTVDTPFDPDGSYVPAQYFTNKQRDRSWQQTLDYSISAIDNLDLLVGAQYINIKTSYPGPATFYLGPTSFNPAVEVPLSQYSVFYRDEVFNRTKEAWAAYADATFHLGDRLSINAGGRYSEETQDVYVRRTSPLRISPSNPVGLVYDTKAYEAATGTEFASKYKKFTPRASIRYEIEPRTSVYVSYSKGFRSGEWPSNVPTSGGGIVGAPSLYRDAKQETVDAYEVGFKHAGSRLRAEVAGFYYDYKNLQVSNTVVSGTSIFTILQNAPSAEIYGAEASFDYEVVENFNVHAGATWLHARYGKGFIYSGTGVNPAVTGFNTNSDPLKTFKNVSLAQDISGDQMARAPNFTAVLGADYLIPNGEGGLLMAVNAKYTDSYVVTDPSIWGGWVANNPANFGNNASLLQNTPYANRANQQRARQGSFVMLNASVTWTDPSNTYYARLWGKNLLDEKFLIHYRPTTVDTYSPLGEPLSFGVTAGIRF